MIEVLISTIPKAVNEILFLFGILGLCYVLRKKGKNNCFLFIIGTTFIMIAWRLVVRINSSRYAAVLIFFFSMYASIAIRQALKKSMILKEVLFVIIAIWLVLWTTKSFNIVANNANLSFLAELHERLNRKDGRCSLYIHKEEMYRLMQMEKGNYMVDAYLSEPSTKNFYSYINDYMNAGVSTLFDMTVDSKANGIDTHDYSNKCKLVLSFFSQKNKKKRHNVYRIQSDAEVKVISSCRSIEPNSGILINGDFEILDSRERSYEKLKGNIINFSDYFNASDPRYTPLHAYFFNDAAYTKYLPDYNCTDTNPISGKYSVRIKIKKGYGHLFFTQHFQNGLFKYSTLIRATKGTHICMFYKTNRNNQWDKLIPLVHFYVPDGRIYSITKLLEVNDLLSQDYFVITLFVNGGEALIDNVSMIDCTKIPRNKTSDGNQETIVPSGPDQNSTP